MNLPQSNNWTPGWLHSFFQIGQGALKAEQGCSHGSVLLLLILWINNNISKQVKYLCLTNPGMSCSYLLEDTEGIQKLWHSIPRSKHCFLQFSFSKVHCLVRHISVQLCVTAVRARVDLAGQEKGRNLVTGRICITKQRWFSIFSERKKHWLSSRTVLGI